MSLELSDLPYAIDALNEHGMSRETMEYIIMIFIIRHTLIMVTSFSKTLPGKTKV